MTSVNKRSSGDAELGVVGNEVIAVMQSESCRRRPCTVCVRTMEPAGSGALYKSNLCAGILICGITWTLMELSTMTEFSGADDAMLLEANATCASIMAAMAAELYCAVPGAPIADRPKTELGGVKGVCRDTPK